MTKKELKETYGLEDIDFHSVIDDHIVIKKSGVRKIKEKIKIHSVNFDLVGYEVDQGRSYAVVKATGATDYYGTVLRHSELGEASPENNDFPYPVAVAQKRAEARLVLKTAGIDRVISEVELDSIKAFKEESIKERIEKAKRGNKK